MHWNTRDEVPTLSKSSFRRDGLRQVRTAEDAAILPRGHGIRGYASIRYRNKIAEFAGRPKACPSPGKSTMSLLDASISNGGRTLRFAT